MKRNLKMPPRKLPCGPKGLTVYMRSLVPTRFPAETSARVGLECKV